MNQLKNKKELSLQNSSFRPAWTSSSLTGHLLAFNHLHKRERRHGVKKEDQLPITRDYFIKTKGQMGRGA